ncbi:MAG: hypothetical protein WCJ30_10840 [Deltaproteobacteria bacterium]
MNTTNTADSTSTTNTATTQDVPPADAAAAAAESATSQLPEAVARLAEDVIDTAVELGAVWVRHGIDIGRLALRTHSAWLGGVSKLLGHVADAMDRTVQRDPTQDADTTAPSDTPAGA